MWLMLHSAVKFSYTHCESHLLVEPEDLSTEVHVDVPWFRSSLQDLAINRGKTCSHLNHETIVK